MNIFSSCVEILADSLCSDKARVIKGTTSFLSQRGRRVRISFVQRFSWLRLGGRGSESTPTKSGASARMS